MPTPKASHRTGPAPAAARGLQLALAALLATLLTVVLAPPSTAAYELGGQPHKPTGTASKRTAVVMESAPRMTRAATGAVQRGTYSKGSTVTLKCYVYGGQAYGRGSANISGGFSSLWYLVSDGYLVADVHLDTGSNTPVTQKCPALFSNVSVSTTVWKRLTSARTGGAVSIIATTAKDGGATRQYAASSSARQRFRFIRDDRGTYRIVSATRGTQVLSAAGARSSSSGAAVTTRTWKDQNSQRWIVRKSARSGYVTIRPASNPRLCLTAAAKREKSLTVSTCGDKGQLFKLPTQGSSSAFQSDVTKFYKATYGRSVVDATGGSRGICRALTEQYVKQLLGIKVSNLGDYVPGGRDGAAKLAYHGLTWQATSSTRGLKSGDIVVFRSTKAGQPGHVGIWYNGRLYDQNNHTRSYFSTARLSPYPVPGMKLVGYWRA